MSRIGGRYIEDPKTHQVTRVETTPAAPVTPASAPAPQSTEPDGHAESAAPAAEPSTTTGVDADKKG